MANNNGQNNKQNNRTVDSVNNSRSVSDSQENTNRFNTSSGRVYNIQNLKPYNKTDRVLSSEEAKRRGSKGGIKSGEVRKARKTMRESLLDLLSQELTPEKLEEMGVDTSTLNGDYTLQSAVLAAMVREAVNGSERAAVLIRDTIGEQPTIRQEITETITREDTQMMDNLTKALIG